MPKLSIIVPVYNVELYIRRCLDSILSQTFDDFEAIIIDDGSLDNCWAIIDEYAQHDNRIIAIHQKNKGVSAARNTGLKIAKGEYIGFVDPDDWIEPDMYLKLVHHIELENCDIASCSWSENDDMGNEKPYVSRLHSHVMSGSDYIKHLFDMPPSISGSAWSKLIRKDIITCEFSTEYTICEDNLFVAQCCANCRKAIYINEPLYHVYARINSATRKRPGIVVYGLPARKEIIQIASGVSRESGMLAEKLFLDQCMAYSGKSINKEYSKYANNIFKKYMFENASSVIQNKKISIKQRIYYFLKFLMMLEV